MKNRKNGIILSYVNIIISAVAGIFLSSFYLKQLGSTEYGIYESISSFINYLVLFEFGTGTIITRNLSLCFAKKENSVEIKKNISTVWYITIFLLIIILIVAILFYFMIGNIYSKTMTIDQISYAKEIFVFLLVYLLLSFLCQTLTGIVLAYENYTFTSKLSIFKTITKLILVVILILYQKKAIIIAIVDAIISIFLFIYSLNYCKKEYKVSISIKYFDKKVLKVSLPLCLALFLQTIVNQANSNVDKFIISITISPEAVSIYSISLYVYSMFSTAANIPISLYAPQVVKEVGKGLSGKDLANRLIQPSRLIVFISGIILFGFISVGKQFVFILYGNKFIDAWIIAIIIMIPMYINVSNGIIINVLDAINKRMVRSIALLITAICNIILTSIWVKKWGIIGAAIATMICTIAGQSLIMNYYYYKKLNLPIFDMFIKSFKGILVYQIIGMIISYLISIYLKDAFISFLVCGIIFILISFGGFLLFGKNEYEESLIKRVIRKNKEIYK